MFEMPKFQKWKIDSNGWGTREEAPVGGKSNGHPGGDGAAAVC